jgi:hypothetical protein
VNGNPVVGSTTAIFDTGSTQIIGDPTGIAKLFDSISGAQSAPHLGDGVYTSAFSNATIGWHLFMYLEYPSPLLVRHPHLY